MSGVRVNGRQFWFSLSPDYRESFLYGTWVQLSSKVFSSPPDDPYFGILLGRSSKDFTAYVKMDFHRRRQPRLYISAGSLVLKAGMTLHEQLVITGYISDSDSPTMLVVFLRIAG
jgi:hypothetical protein